MQKPEKQKLHSDVIGTQSSKQTINAGASYTSGVISLQGIKAVLAGMQVVFGGTPDGNAKLEVLTSPNDSNYDTVAYTVFEIDYSASSTLMKSVPVNADALYVKIKITNLDSADSIDVWGFVTLTQELI